MKCPKCYATLKQIPGTNKLEVDCITRTKKCLNCGYTFETVEIDRDMYERIVGKPHLSERR